MIDFAADSVDKTDRQNLHDLQVADASSSSGNSDSNNSSIDAGKQEPQSVSVGRSLLAQLSKIAPKLVATEATAPFQSGLESTAGTGDDSAAYVPVPILLPDLDTGFKARNVSSVASDATSTAIELGSGVDYLEAGSAIDVTAAATVQASAAGSDTGGRVSEAAAAGGTVSRATLTTALRRSAVALKPKVVYRREDIQVGERMREWVCKCE